MQVWNEQKERQSERENKEETLLFFLGVDNDGKEKIARKLAKLLFGF